PAVEAQRSRQAVERRAGICAALPALDGHGRPASRQAATQYRGADRRRDDDGRDARRVQPRAGGGRRGERQGADGGASTDATTRVTSALTASFDCSASMIAQPRAAAWRR